MGLPSRVTGSEIPLEPQHLQTLKENFQLTPYAPIWYQAVRAVSGPQQSHRGYVKHVGLRDMKQHAMGSASLGTMLLLRECASQEEGQGPRGHKA